MKEISKRISYYLQTGILPIPDELVEVLQTYLDKFLPFDDSDSQKLHEELLSIYHKDVQGQRKRYAPFLPILRQLRPAIARHKQLLQWWDVLVVPILVLLSEEKGLAEETRAILLDVLAPDDDIDNGNDEGIARTSIALSRKLLGMWLERSGTEYDANATFLKQHIHDILMDFGRKRPRDILTAIDPFFVQKEHRCQILTLLGDFIRQSPPHLHVALETPLFNNLLRCLQTDTSTTVVSLALTALIMLLPHAPNGIRKHLPTLFNIYARLLFWDREAASVMANVTDQMPETDGEESSNSEEQWERLSSHSESEDTNIPQLLTFFTFLYGLYPMNFMSYIRKPSRYLRHAAPDADDLDVQSTEVRQRSEQFRQFHLLHPNFFNMTIDSELTDRNRWQRSMAADVTASCMALYYPSQSSTHFFAEASDGPSTWVAGSSDANDDQGTSMLSQDEDDEGPNASWRYTTSTIVVSPEEASQAFDTGLKSPTARIDSPTLPPQVVASNVDESEPIEKDAKDIEISVANGPTEVSALQREIMLLKNDLNFERYLKQQHLVHIGQLRRKHVREVTIESETQNLLNANRALKSKLEEARNTVFQTKKESEKSRSHAKKWEVELVSKLRVVKEEDKKLTAKNEILEKELATAHDDFMAMKKLIVAAESRELLYKQKVQTVEADIEELDRLRKEVEILTVTLHGYEAHEQEHDDAKTDEAVALSRVADLEMKLASVIAESERVNTIHIEEIDSLKSRLQSARQEARKEYTSSFQSMMDQALSATLSRLADLQKAHANLQKRYTRLETQYISIRDREPHSGEEPLLSNHDFPGWSRLPAGSSAVDYRRNRTFNTMDLASGILGSTADRPGTGQQQRRIQTEATSSHSGSGSTDGSRPSNDEQGKPKSEPPAELRIYGRGGFGNITSAKKKKEDKLKEESKKDKKSGSLRGIRGFVG